MARSPSMAYGFVRTVRKGSMQIRTILVASDLTERGHPAIVRGAELATTHGAKLVVCHVVPAQAGSHPLFPQQYIVDATSAASLDQRIADTLSQLVTSLTSRPPDAFDILID